MQLVMQFENGDMEQTNHFHNILLILSNKTAMHIQENQMIFSYIIFNCSYQQIYAIM